MNNQVSIVLSKDLHLPKQQTERIRAILEAYRHGETLERVAIQFELSIARVHEIIKQLSN